MKSEELWLLAQALEQYKLYRSGVLSFVGSGNPDAPAAECRGRHSLQLSERSVVVSFAQIKSIKPIKPSPSGEGGGEYLEPSDEGKLIY